MGPWCQRAKALRSPLIPRLCFQRCDPRRCESSAEAAIILRFIRLSGKNCGLRDPSKVGVDLAQTWGFSTCHDFSKSPKPKSLIPVLFVWAKQKGPKLRATLGTRKVIESIIENMPMQYPHSAVIAWAKPRVRSHRPSKGIYRYTT